MSPNDFEVRALVAASRARHLDARAFRALRRATDLLATALGVRLGQLRCYGPPTASGPAHEQELAYQLPRVWDVVTLLSARWEKLPARERPHYTPLQRCQILRLKDELVLSAAETATIFGLSHDTVDRWESELRRAADPSTVTTIGSLFRPAPPARRYADVVRQVARSLQQMGLGGDDLLSRHFARLGWSLSASTLGRIRKERRAPSPPPGHPGADEAHTTADRRVRAKAPLDKALIDITSVRSLFGLFSFRIALVLDAFSRIPLAFRVFDKEPTAAEIVDLLGDASRHGPPRVLVTDRGSAFTSELFRSATRSLGTELRFGAIGKSGSIALIERFWRTLKDSLGVRLFKPLTAGDLERRLGLALTHYALFRPHEALGGATPAEAFARLPPASEHAVPPPRGRPGEVVPFPEYGVRFLDPERRLPVVVRVAA